MVKRGLYIAWKNEKLCRVFIPYSTQNPCIFYVTHSCFGNKLFCNVDFHDKRPSANCPESFDDRKWKNWSSQASYRKPARHLSAPVLQPRFVSRAISASKLINTNAEIPEFMPLPNPALRVCAVFGPWAVCSVCEE
jgi:hypothetical protein